MSGNEHLPILVVEDSDEDFDILTMTFHHFGIANAVHRCSQGEDVLPFLEAVAQTGEKVPGLILLDLNLIGLDGRDVLKQLKGHPSFRRIPTIVLSTSASPKDVDACYLEGANSYSVKPVDLEQLEKFVNLLKQYWLESVILPRPSPLELIRKSNA